jgi:hypothetical protein
MVGKILHVGIITLIRATTWKTRSFPKDTSIYVEERDH